jgi:hypothetical protein
VLLLLSGGSASPLDNRLASFSAEGDIISEVHFSGKILMTHLSNDQQVGSREPELLKLIWLKMVSLEEEGFQRP